MMALLTFYGKFLAASAVLLTLYWVLLRERVSYRWARLYLLLLPLVSLLLSGPRLEVYTVTKKTSPILTSSPRPLLTSPKGEELHSAGFPAPLGEVRRGLELALCILCASVSAILLLLALFYILKMYRLRRKLGVVPLVDGYRVVRSRTVDTPFSFIDTIFLPLGMTHTAEDYILRHEVSHVQHRHYVDVLCIELLTRLLWFNPVLWVSRNELRNVHEFEADRDVVSSGVNLQTYQSLLMEYSMEDSSVVANGFNHSFVRRRFIEMRRRTWGTLGRLGQSLAVVALLLVVCSFTMKVGEREVVVVEKGRTLSPALPHHGEGEDVADVKEDASASEDVEKEEASSNSEPEEAGDTSDAARTASPLPIAGSTFPLNTSAKVTHTGFYLKRTADATHLVCVATPESDDEVYHLGSGDNTYIVDEERGVHYRARGSQPSGTWAQDFHVRGMKGQSIALTIVFPPIPEYVEHVRIYGVGDWNLRGQEFRVKDIEER
ncbi:MAG: hypothetical protein IJV06_12675 [Bacteroidaceae bacterium]|nr:hypothetical protein [Bacteroidaceae bacterium]MBQ9642385.1 hypothetical protein [Bacteroidaceae bacterium]